MGVDLTEFSDEQIHTAYYKAQSVHGLEGLPYAELMSVIRTYAAGIEKSSISSPVAREESWGVRKVGGRQESRGK